MRPSESWAASVFGGKNSNEYVLPAARRSATLVIRPPRVPVGICVRRGHRRPGQCRKWRSPVNTMAMPCSSAAAMTSASRTLPPGWITAVMPAAAAASMPSRNGKKASLAQTPADDSIAGPVGGDPRRVEAVLLAGADAEAPADLGRRRWRSSSPRRTPSRRTAGRPTEPASALWTTRPTRRRDRSPRDRVSARAGRRRSAGRRASARPGAAAVSTRRFALATQRVECLALVAGRHDDLGEHRRQGGGRRPAASDGSPRRCRRRRSPGRRRWPARRPW